MTERDKILKALRDVPGVFELNSDPSVTVFQRKWVAGGVGVGYYTESGSLVIQSCETKRNATLAEAVAALTPSAEPRKPTYDFVAGIKGATARQSPCDFYCSSVALKTDDSVVMICFGKNDEIAKVYVNNSKFCESPEDYDPEISVLLATPQTEPEVLATLRMCRVEVK